MNPQRDKHLLRRLRTIPLDAIEPRIAASEAAGNATLCLVGGEVEFVRTDGSTVWTTWDDPLDFAQIVRYLQAHPERVHATRESALAYAKSRRKPG